MKLRYHHRRLLQHLLDHPDFAHGLHTQQVIRKVESLIRMGYIDQSWRVTEAGKSRLLSEQQQQQTLSERSSNQASQTIGTDINNAATQAELLRAEQLSFQYNSQLAFYAQAKAQQIDDLQVSLQSAIHSQATKRTAIEQQQPAWPATKQARTTWQNQMLKLKRDLLNSNADPKGWGRSPRTQASTRTLCLMNVPPVKCVSTILTSPDNRLLYSNNNARPPCKTFNLLKRSSSTWVELVP
jgi:hypothetical protein